LTTRAAVIDTGIQSRTWGMAMKPDEICLMLLRDRIETAAPGATAR
jgi:hypothetical protein